MIWDFAGVALLIWVDRRFKLRPPSLFALYVSYYCFGRFFEELIRVDPAHHVAGLRLNAWVSLIVFICSTGFFIWWQRRDPAHRVREPKRPEPRQGPAMAIPKGRVR